ncbi:hypothetical protein N431DRAFT_391517, partial [Stipitochalara longipes BDJ]
MASPGSDPSDSALVPRPAGSIAVPPPGSSSTAAPTLRPSLAVAALVQHAPLRIGMMTFDTTRAVVDFVATHPVEEQYDLQRAVLQHLNDHNEKFDDMLYTADLDEVIIRVKNVNERRDRRQEAVRGIKKLLESSQRGEALYNYFLDRDEIKGKNANPTQGDHGDVLGLRSTDCENAWASYKAEEAAGQLSAWVKPMYTHDELQALGLGWGTCGILEAGVFFRQAEPTFDDEVVQPSPVESSSPLSSLPGSSDDEIEPVTPVKKRKRAADRSYTPG